MKWVFNYLKPLSSRITIGITVKIIGTVAELIIPFLLSYILENVIESNDIGKILFYGMLMAICAVIACLGNIIANRMAAKTTMIFSTHMRKDLFSKTLHLSARSTDKFTIPSLESRITSDTYNVQNFIGMMQRMGIRAPILLLGGSVITLIMDRKLALVMIATLPISSPVYLSLSAICQEFLLLNVDDKPSLCCTFFQYSNSSVYNYNAQFPASYHLQMKGY